MRPASTECLLYERPLILVYAQFGHQPTRLRPACAVRGRFLVEISRFIILLQQQRLCCPGSLPVIARLNPSPDDVQDARGIFVGLLQVGRSAEQHAFRRRVDSVYPVASNASVYRSRHFRGKVKS